MPQAKRPKLPASSAQQQLADRLRWNSTRSADAADSFTIGFSGKKIEEILALLQKHRIRTLVDIRWDTVSLHRPELSPRNLVPFLEANGLRYAHVRELGVPRNIRAKAAAAGTRDVIWAWYDRHVRTTFPDLRAFLKNFDSPVALLCAEVDPFECHRHRLARILEEAGAKTFDL